MATPPYFRAFSPPIMIYTSTPVMTVPSYALMQALTIMADRTNFGGMGNGPNLPPDRVEVIFISDDGETPQPPAAPPSGGKPPDGGEDMNKPGHGIRFPFLGRAFNIQSLAFQLLSKFQFLDSRGNPLIPLGPRPSSPFSPALPLPLAKEKPLEQPKEVFNPIPENNLENVSKKGETFFKPLLFALLTPDASRPIDKKDPSSPTLKTAPDATDSKPKREDRIEIKPPTFQGENVKKEMQPPPQLKEALPLPKEQNKEMPIKGEVSFSKPAEGHSEAKTATPALPMNKSVADPAPNPMGRSGDAPLKEGVINDAPVKSTTVTEAPAKNLTLGPNESRTPAQAAQEVSSSGVKPQPQAPTPPQSPPNPSTGIIGPAITTNPSQGSSSRKKEKKRKDQEHLEESFDQEEDLEDFLN